MTSPLRAIKDKCLDCCGSREEVQLCACPDCSLWPFRFGKKPQETNEQGYIEFKPRKKQHAIWGIRIANWTKVEYVFETGQGYVAKSEWFEKTEEGLELAKQKAREEINK